MRRWIAVAWLVGAGCLSSPGGADPPGDDAGAGMCPDPMTAPGGPCPGECDSCDGATCVIDCVGAGCATINCPAGFDCRVSCFGKDRCVGVQLNCPDDYECSLVCSGEDACELVTMNCAGGGLCELVCGSDPIACTGTTLNCSEGPCQAACDGATVLPTVNCDGSCMCLPCEAG